jgi:hypothetical protein
MASVLANLRRDTRVGSGEGGGGLTGVFMTIGRVTGDGGGGNTRASRLTGRPALIRGTGGRIGLPAVAGEVGIAATDRVSSQACFEL